jgi:hypothetical protein
MSLESRHFYYHGDTIPERIRCALEVLNVEEIVEENNDRRKAPAPTSVKTAIRTGPTDPRRDIDPPMGKMRYR